MNKKFSWLFLALITAVWCTLLWAEEDNPWDKVLQFKEKDVEVSLSASPDVLQSENPSRGIFSSISGEKIRTKGVSPLDFCSTNPFAHDCTNSCFLGSFPGGWIWRYQDPSLECPDPYPFEVDFYTVWVSNCTNVDCEIIVDAGVYAVDNTKQVCGSDGPICPTPGPLLCAWDQLVITIDALSGCYPIGYDLADLHCCVNGPYFIGVHWTCPDDAHCRINPCLEIFGSDTCGTWYWDCKNTSDTLNFRCDLGLPNACIKSEGFTVDQNNCPTPELKCRMTNLCVALDSLRPCAQKNPLAPDRRYFSFQDPKKACPPSDTCSTYPFEVDAVQVMLSNCGTDTDFVHLEPFVYSVHYPTDTLCPEPDTLICQGPPVLLKIPPGANCLHFVLPLSDTCCVKTSYFAGFRVIQTALDSIRICIDSSCMPYWNYIQFPIHPKPVDPCPLGLTGDFAMWSSGFPSCKNNCPHDNRGIDTVYFTPGIYSGDVGVNLIFSIDVDDPLVNKNFSCNLELYIDGQLEQTVPETVHYQPTTGSATAGVTCLGFAPCSEEECGTALGVPLYCKPIEIFGRPCDCRTDIFVKFPFSPPSAPSDPPAPAELRLVPLDIPCPPVICDPPPFFIQETYTADDSYSTLFDLPGCTARPGDLNGDNKFTLVDIVSEVNVVFKGAAPPNPLCRGDANASGGNPNLTDIIYLVNTVFKGGPNPKTVPVCCL